MLFVDRVFLVKVDFEEFIMYIAFEIFCDVNHLVVTGGNITNGVEAYLPRIQLLEICIDKVIFSDFQVPLVSLAFSGNKVPLGLQGSVVHLSNKLNSIRLTLCGRDDRIINN